MIETAVKRAFNLAQDIVLKKLSTGLINHTYKTTASNGDAFLLQQINTQVFPEPLLIQQNYQKIQKHLLSHNSFQLPQIVTTQDGDLIYQDGDSAWRCFEFAKNTYSPHKSSNANEAWLVANCFGKFSAELSDLEPSTISVVLPGFHDLALRFNQFETALNAASEERKKLVKGLIEKAYENIYLVDFYKKISTTSTQYPLHILHHDCKIANILFNEKTNEIFSPIDLDTTQPGLFFSDIGDMVRSMAPNISEGETDLENMILREDFYQAIRDGYLTAMSNHLTKEELENIDLSGKLIVYMQALRFLADYLNNDVYYQIEYGEQNKDRAANQFYLLSLLNDYIKSNSAKQIYLNS
ncbi:phosphotransferase enzyme family protein [Arachidicoccus soli]|uniref:Aminoglycoside phosphotransferase domain-containing protein n=1 Tax=Arachidicoccus soli TaxID=2341117 RepID=A0A386HMZ0_9BACT|nr:phosphotransferase [Arachidicoccus soli]AYD46890.1 hypothetical protein D6B99_04230 [Arachidicoccus soli]